MNNKSFALELFKINAIKFGNYKTKVGIMTPVYCDLRVIVSYPKLLEVLAVLIERKMKCIGIGDGDVICGVPYTALPIATAVSLKSGVPMVMRRKEAKSYGTKKIIEGVFEEGQKCLIIEDVVTSGSSVLETVHDLEESKLKCTDAIVLLNRQQGGKKILENNGIRLHALMTLTELVEILFEFDKIDYDMRQKVFKYLEENQVKDSLLKEIPPPEIKYDRLKTAYSIRAKVAKNPMASKLFEIMATKETNLCVAADLTNSTDLLNLAEEIGPHICALKTHIDILEDFHCNLLEPLKFIAQKHNFLLFEDRKFADIGQIVYKQFSEGVYKISSWADLITAHAITGPAVLEAVKQNKGNHGVFLLAETSSKDNLIGGSYTKSTLNLANKYEEVVAGIVCQSPLFNDNAGLIQLTPGVQLEAKEDALGQQYNSPEVVVLEKGADVAVVGRGITQAKDAKEAAIKYQKILWEAYLKRIES